MPCWLHQIAASRAAHFGAGFPALASLAAAMSRIIGLSILALGNHYQHGRTPNQSRARAELNSGRENRGDTS